MVLPYQERDLEIIRAWHEASAFDYPLPDLSSPLMCLLGVAESDGIPVAAAGVRLIGEAYYWQDHAARPYAKAKAMVELHTALEANARQMGLDQVIAWLPPGVAQDFSTRIEKFGWKKSVWSSYAKNLT